jgi:hypothetical protein
MQQSMQMSLAMEVSRSSLACRLPFGGLSLSRLQTVLIPGGWSHYTKYWTGGQAGTIVLFKLFQPGKYVKIAFKTQTLTF